MRNIKETPSRRKKREEKARAKKIEEMSELVKLALEKGQTTRRAICDMTGLKAHQLATLFSDNKELYLEYTLRRRTLVDTAADNIQEIVDDPTHPKHFEASKYVLQKYKSDLDTILPSKEIDDIVAKIDMDNEVSKGRVSIVFGSSKEESK